MSERCIFECSDENQKFWEGLLQLYLAVELYLHCEDGDIDREYDHLVARWEKLKRMLMLRDIDMAKDHGENVKRIVRRAVTDAIGEGLLKYKDENY